MKELILAIALSVSATSEAPEKRIWSADRIEWQRIDKDGTKYAVLDGNRDEAGKPFTYAFWMPGGVWVKPHTHTQQAHVAVVKGSIKLGYGTKMDKSKTVELKAGQFFIVRAGEAHFEGSDGECLIIGTALGGWKTKELE
jgi:mannose-6-phosphate isomerase-like protein (cupin superfamily)